jgi:5,10-methylenetetrahydromethanopterin reductase
MIELGIILDGRWPLEQMITYSKLSEESGFAFVGITDGILGMDPFVVLAAIAGKTLRIRLGTNVINPYARHPAILAASMATISEISDGRADLGIGSSRAGSLGRIGITLEKPVLRCKEAVEVIKKLFVGEKVNYRGKIFELNNAELRIKPRARIPVYVGAQGPKMLQMSSTVADGIILPPATFSFYRYATELFLQEVKRTGRQRSEVKIAADALISISEDRNEAFASVRPYVAEAIAWKTPYVLKAMGISRELAMAAKKDFRLVTNEIVERFAICGTIHECLDKIRKFSALGIDRLNIAFPSEETMRIVGTSIIPMLEKK